MRVGRIFCQSVLCTVLMSLVVVNWAKPVSPSRYHLRRFLHRVDHTNSAKWETCLADGNFPNYNDCRTYFQCANGYRYLMECPSGLIWNVELEYCDWENSTECVENPRKPFKDLRD